MGSNASQLAHFDPRVTMWVFEEDIGGRKLTEIINTQHENVKYLPGHKLPPNVVSSNRCERRAWQGRGVPRSQHSKLTWRCLLLKGGQEATLNASWSGGTAGGLPYAWSTPMQPLNCSFGLFLESECITP